MLLPINRSSCVRRFQGPECDNFGVSRPVAVAPFWVFQSVSGVVHVGLESKSSSQSGPKLSAVQKQNWLSLRRPGGSSGVAGGSGLKVAHAASWPSVQVMPWSQPRARQKDPSLSRKLHVLCEHATVSMQTRLAEVEKRLAKLEDSVALLETKLQSLPGEKS